MITVVVLTQLFQAFVVCKAKSTTKGLYVGMHHRGEFRKAYAADGGVLVEHADVLQIVQFAEDAELREFGDAGNENKLQVRVELLERTIEVLHDEAKLGEVVLLVNHIEQRGVIFVYDNNCFLPCLLIGALNNAS